MAFFLLLRCFISRRGEEKKAPKVSHDKVFHADVTPSFKFIISAEKQKQQNLIMKKIIFNFAKRAEIAEFMTNFYSVNIFPGFVCFLLFSGNIYKFSFLLTWNRKFFFLFRSF